MNYILQSYNLDKIPVEMRGKGVSGLLEMLGLGKTQIIYGYDEEAFRKLAMGTPMVMWDVEGYDYIVQNRPIRDKIIGHTFIYKYIDNSSKKPFIFWDQSYKSLKDEKRYNEDFFKNKIEIGFRYSKNFTDLEDILISLEGTE